MRFAEEREEWLRQWLKLPGGVPSDDTFRRIFTALDPERFNECFIEFSAALNKRLGLEFVALDGKTLRGSFQAPDKSDALHPLSAWAAGSGLTLGQLLVDSKSNEIAAVPKLLRQLDVKGCVVSLDALGCRKKIAIAIRHAEADYLRASRVIRPACATGDLWHLRQWRDPKPAFGVPFIAGAPFRSPDRSAAPSQFGKGRRGTRCKRRWVS